MKTRASGVLMPIFSLPNDFGFGSFFDAPPFLDWLKSAGFSLWQILPINPIGEGFSPYMSPSAFGIDPLFISPESFLKKGYLFASELKNFTAARTEKINYKDLITLREELYSKVFSRFIKNPPEAFYEFERNHEWLQPHSLFFAIKKVVKLDKLSDFPNELKLRQKEALKSFESAHKAEILKEKMLQFFAFEDWLELKKQAAERGIGIIGDMPIYVSPFSADVWANSEAFLLDKELNPKRLGGCPPDEFSPEGQLWGNPVYNWEKLKKNKFSYPLKRIRHNLELFDILRLDHFRGYESFFSIPKNAKTAKKGKWQKGGGKDFISAVNSLGFSERIIAEDLGFLTNKVRSLLSFSGYPGMKILQFIIGENEKSEHLPCLFSENSVCYTGTHDNDTLKGRLCSEKRQNLEFLCQYFGCDYAALQGEIIRSAFSSVSRYCIIPIGDILELPSEGRINTPGTAQGNWEWRLPSLEPLQKKTELYKKYNSLYRRSNKNERF